MVGEAARVTDQWWCSPRRGHMQWLTVALASMVEGETMWRLLGWEEPLGIVWLRWSTGFGCGALVEFLLYWRVALLSWLDRLGDRRHGRCIVVDLFDACSLVFGSVLPRVIVVRCCVEPVMGLLISMCCSCHCTNSASC
jgi:hypothetical protein